MYSSYVAIMYLNKYFKSLLCWDSFNLVLILISLLFRPTSHLLRMCMVIISFRPYTIKVKTIIFEATASCLGYHSQKFPVTANKHCWLLLVTGDRGHTVTVKMLLGYFLQTAGYRWQLLTSYWRWFNQQRMLVTTDSIAQLVLTKLAWILLQRVPCYWQILPEVFLKAALSNVLSVVIPVVGSNTHIWPCCRLW